MASGERVGGNAWTVDDETPLKYLQANSHEAATVGYDVNNAPEYYARAIMAYVALGQPERVFIAGTPRVDLLAKLYTYQDTTASDPANGSFSPSSSNRAYQAVDTTAWAILALHASDSSTGLSSATDWLQNQQNGDGGFPDQAGVGSNVIDTALAIQALELASAVPSSTISKAEQYLKSTQRSDGGFPTSPGGPTDAQATAAAIQAILAMGETQANWAVDGNTPAAALGKLQIKSGAYDKRHNSTVAPVATTSWALMALSGGPFTTFPKSRPAAVKPFAFRVALKTIAPKDHTTFTDTRVVLIRATYADGAGGTGINAMACRLYVDDVNRSKAAAIGPYGLHLRAQQRAQRRAQLRAAPGRLRRQRAGGAALLHGGGAGYAGDRRA